jgi:hypothetical protein
MDLFTWQEIEKLKEENNKLKIVLEYTEDGLELVKQENAKLEKFQSIAIHLMTDNQLNQLNKLLKFSN